MLKTKLSAFGSPRLLLHLIVHYRADTPADGHKIFVEALARSCPVATLAVRPPRRCSLNAPCLAFTSSQPSLKRGGRLRTFPLVGAHITMRDGCIRHHSSVFV